MHSQCTHTVMACFDPCWPVLKWEVATLPVGSDSELVAASIAPTWPWREIPDLIGPSLPIFRIRKRLLFRSDVGPNIRIFSVERQPFFLTGLGIRLDRLGWAFRLAHAAVGAFVGVDHQHVLALVKTIHGADLHAVHVFAFDAVFSDDISHGAPLSAVRDGRFYIDSSTIEPPRH